MKQGTLLLMLAVMLWHPCGAQQTARIMQQLDSVANPPIASCPALHFDSEILSVETLCEDDKPLNCNFNFKNCGSTPLVITKILTSCGCVDVSFDRQPVLSGANGRIDVSFDPHNQAGVLNRHIYVYTNASITHPSARLTLRGEVLPTQDRWRDYRIILGSSLRARRKTVVFRQMLRTQLRTERIECVNTGDKPLHLVAVEGECPPFISFRSEPEVIVSGAVADLVITVDGSATPKATRGWQQFMVGIENQSYGIKQKSIGVEVEFMD